MSRRAGVAALVVATGVLFLARLGHSPLLEPDEGRYAEIAREMVASGDWLVPRLDGIPYLQKPPLVYWATAAAYRLRGVSEAMARLVPALAAIATVLVTAALAARGGGAAVGLVAGVMLATTPLFYLVGRLAILDMPLTFFLSCAVIGLRYAARAGDRRWQLAAGLAMAGGVMTKGLVGVVLPVAVTVATALVERDPGALRRTFGPAAIIPVLVLPAGWFWAVERREAGFLAFFFVRHHLMRYAGAEKLGHAHPPWYLPLVFVAGALPWSLVRLGIAVREGASRWRDADATTDRWLDLWMVIMVAFFSLSRLSVATYVCPAFVPLAARTARAAVDGRVGRRPVLVWLALAACALAVALAATVHAPLVERVLYPRWWPQARALRPPLLVAACAASVGGLVALRAGTPLAAMVAVAAGLAVGLPVLETARPMFPSAARMGAVLRARGGEADRVVVVGRLPLGLPFYARRRITVAGWPGTRDLGPREPRVIVWRERDVVRWWNGRRRLFVVITPADWRRLRPRLRRAASVLAAADGRVLVTNAPLGVRPWP